MLGTELHGGVAGDGSGQVARPLALGREDNHHRIRPSYHPPDRTALAREAGLGCLLLPSVLGTSGTLREGSTNCVPNQPGSPLGAGPSWIRWNRPAAPGRRQHGPAGQFGHRELGSTVALLAVRQWCIGDIGR